MNNEKLYGNSIGVIIQNNDPEKRGRVKVFVPHVSYGMYKNWTQEELDKLFNNLGDESLGNILDELREVLPWAEIAGPLFGGNASGRFNSPKKEVYASNSSIWNEDTLLQGNRPAAAFTGAGRLHDGFNNAANTGILNPYTFEYNPADYSSLAAGMFSVPNVGAHVWVFFENGDFNAPVYFASSYSEADYKRIYTTVKFTDKTLTLMGKSKLDKASVSVDYPAEYQNSDVTPITQAGKTFRAKYVINTNKNVIELIDTDGREMIKTTHFSGSFKEFNNYTNSEFAANNDQKLVLGNQFETIRKDKNVSITGHNRVFVNGDSYLKVGNYNYDTVLQAKSILGKINDYKQLFDTQRVGRMIYKRIEGSQSLMTITGVNALSPHQEQVAAEGFEGLVEEGEASYNNGFVQCPICGNTPYKVDTSTWSLAYSVIPIEPVEEAVATGEGEAAVSGFETALVLPEEIPLYEDLIKLEEKKAFDNGDENDTPEGIGFWKGGKCDVCNSDYLKPPLRRPGFNTSTEHGLFKLEPAKQGGGEMYTFYNENRKELNELLATLEGGDYINEIHKNKIENIGLVMNDSMAHRVDPIGKMRAESVFVAPEGVYVAGKPTPHVESVDVAEVPGGNYLITAANKYKLIVGAKGVNIKTFGPIDMYGSIVNFTGEQINIGSQNEINIDAGEKLLIRARKTTIVSKDHEPVCIESPLHVSRNTIIRGGMYVDGEVGLRHITSLREYGVTLGPMAPLDAELVIGEDGADNHVHLYERIPSTFFNSAEEVRAFLNDPSNGLGATINSRAATTAAASVSPFTGRYTAVVQQALDDCDWDNIVHLAVQAQFGLTGPWPDRQTPPTWVLPPMPGSHEIKNAITVVDENIEASVIKRFNVTKEARPIAMWFNITVPVKAIEGEAVAESDIDEFSSSSQTYEWVGGTIKTTYDPIATKPETPTWVKAIFTSLTIPPCRGAPEE